MHRVNEFARPLLARAARAATLLGLILAASACDLRLDRQEVFCRYDAEQDCLDVLLIYHGITTEEQDSKHHGKGIEVLHRLLAGRREFMLGNWPLYWDLDGLQQSYEKDLAEAAAEPSDDTALEAEEARTALELLSHISLSDRKLFLQEGRLCGYQRLQVRTLKGAVQLGNRLIHAAVRQAAVEAADRATQDPDAIASGEDELWDDARSRELRMERARRGQDWFSWDEQGLRVDIPLSDDSCRTLRRGLLANAFAEEQDSPGFVAALGALLVAVRAIEFPGESVVVTLGGPDASRFRFELDDPEIGDQRSFVNVVRDAGIDLSAKVDLEALRAALR